MRSGHETHDDPPTHGGDHGGALIWRPRRYELGVKAQFLGRRRRTYDKLVAHSGAQPGDRALDLGCGTGYFTRRAARAVGPEGQVVGIDPSQAVIDHAARVAPANCTFRLAGAQALPFEDGSFDVVISSLALHHLPAGEQPTALDEAYRVLRPGGRLLIAELLGRPLHIRVAGRLLGRRGGHAVHHDPMGNLPDLIAGAGFEVTGQGEHRPWFQYVQARRPA